MLDLIQELEVRIRLPPAESLQTHIRVDFRRKWIDPRRKRSLRPADSLTRSARHCRLDAEPGRCEIVVVPAPTINVRTIPGVQDQGIAARIHRTGGRRTGVDPADREGKGDDRADGFRAHPGSWPIARGNAAPPVARTNHHVAISAVDIV